MRRITKKREQQLKQYLEAKKKLFLDDLKAGKLVCFLSNQPIRITDELKGESDNTLASLIEVHHIKNDRTNENLFDEEVMKPVIRTYHSMYHSLPSKELLNLSWYQGYLCRIKISHPDLYDKEMTKHEK